MKKGWETKALGDVCDFEGGSQPPKSQFLYEEKRGYVRFLQIRDFGSDKNITYIPQAKKNRLCNESDILIGRYGASVGKILTDKAGAYNVALMKTLPNLAVLNRAWFYNYLLSDEFQLRLLNVADRSAQAGFSKDDIYNFPVPLPPLAEQQRIVGLLDEAFEGIATAKANAEKNLQNARALFESHLQSVFSQRGKGWAEKPLEEVVIIGDGNHSSNYPKKEELVPDGVPFIRATNLVDGKVSGEDMRFLSPKKHAQLKKGHLKTGDVLFTNRGEIGKTAIVDSDYDGANLNSQIAWLRCRENLNNRFLFHVLNSEGMKTHFELSKNGAALQQFTIRQIRELKIPLPPKSEQSILVTRLDALGEETKHLATLYTRKLAALEALKKSLLHQAFSGRI